MLHRWWQLRNSMSPKDVHVARKCINCSIRLKNKRIVWVLIQTGNKFKSIYLIFQQALCLRKEYLRHWNNASISGMLKCSISFCSKWYGNSNILCSCLCENKIDYRNYWFRSLIYKQCKVHIEIIYYYIPCLLSELLHHGEMASTHLNRDTNLIELLRHAYYLAT